jgi:putative DNA primase/helicase
MDEVIDAFRRAIEDRGLAPRRIDADGRVHRCGTTAKPKSKNGAYCLHLDGKVPAGWFQNHEDGLGVTTWRAERLTVMSEAERIEWRKQMELRQAQRDKDLRTRHLAAAGRAKFIFDRATDATPAHPYLARKRVKPHGVKTHKGLLVVPIHNGVGGLVNLQFIAADGAKKFLTGGEKRGCFFVIGDPDHEPEGLCIGEGFATMATVHEATGYMCVVAFDCGNLKPVAEVWRKKLPSARIVICADNDQAGIASAKEVARDVANCGIALPVFHGGTAA